MKRFLYNVYEDIPDPTVETGCIRRTIWSFESEIDARRLRRFIELRDLNYPKIGMAKFTFEVDDTTYEREMKELHEKRRKSIEDKDRRRRLEMDKQIRKIEGEVKHAGKDLKHLEKEDKKRDRVCEVGKKVMKKKAMKKKMK